MNGQVHDPLASIRVSLRWPPAPAFEDTDTLVISGRTGFFLDLRFFTSGTRQGQIDWASAGWKRWLPDSTPENPKASFEALIDSRRSNANPAPEGPPDEGSFSKLPNGDTLETGSMANLDAGGAVQPYEEVWRRLALPKDVHVLILVRSDGRSFLGRVGKYQLGLQDQSEDGSEAFMARKWEVVEAGEWQQTYSTGSELDSALPLLPRTVQGDKVQLGSCLWNVIENA